VIRPAVCDDARAIAELEVRAWRWAFVDIVDETSMPTVDAREARWLTQPLDGAFVAEVGDRVVGVVEIGSAGDAGGAAGTLCGPYVEPAAQGAGVGAALHDHAVAQLRAAGSTAATLRVFAANGHARGFYERRGWFAEGPAGEAEDVPELRYRRAL
jgi:GNAT superfamily N-acetyltransferase